MRRENKEINCIASHGIPQRHKKFQLKIKKNEPRL